MSADGKSNKFLELLIDCSFTFVYQHIITYHLQDPTILSLELSTKQVSEETPVQVQNFATSDQNKTSNTVYRWLVISTTSSNLHLTSYRLIPNQR